MTTLGSKGQPQFSGADNVTLAQYLTQLGTYAATVGNRITGTASDRANFGAVYGFAPFAGLEMIETDTFNQFLFNGTGWVGIQIQSALVSFDQSAMTAAGGGWQLAIDQPLVSGRFTSPPIITTGVYTQSTSNQHVGVANVTTTSFRLYLWRADRATTSVNWVANPSIQ